MEVLIDVELKKQTPLEFLSTLKAWLENGLKEDCIEEYAIMQEVGNDIDYLVLDQNPPKRGQAPYIPLVEDAETEKE